MYCNHIACFDAVTWFEMNEQTPQWQCPICNKTLKVEDMLVDGCVLCFESQSYAWTDPLQSAQLL